jgi:hypothetical protein
VNADEKLVMSYLNSIGFREIKYEPDGNVPPDFLVENRVAVEVRRLNQNHDDEIGTRGLEEVAISLWQNMRRYLESLGPSPAAGASWYVFYRFSRPVPQWRKLKKELDAILKPFMVDTNPQPLKRKVHDNFEIKLVRSPVQKPTFFRAIGHSDEQSGG